MTTPSRTRDAPHARGIQVEVFNQLLAAIAEEMGAALMRAALSPNIKERRDFSCAIFDAEGQLLAQAAHIPVHLGSQPLSVEAAIEHVDMHPGDAVLLNDPYCGGTHLPDLTLVSPVFSPDGDTLWFYVANRAHHADVGGITPGSLPLGTSIDDEGIRIPPTRLDEALFEQILDATRTPTERRGDLRAQRAANRLGRRRLQTLGEELGAETVRARGGALLDYSERVMRATIADIPDGEYAFEDVMEDDGQGTRDVAVRVTLTVDGDRAIVDLRDSDPQTKGPINAVHAIAASAAYYAFRCLAPIDLPTNLGCYRPIEVRTEPGTVVDAKHPAPVAVGNVETSQRIVDVVFGALAEALPDRIPAQSCGTMNNVLLGSSTEGSKSNAAAFAYYETLAGGAGAAPEGDGASAVHTHMTNTLNTPVEALEHAYPFRVERYAVRRGSGGRGRRVGGDGIVRAYRMTVPTTATLQTERRRRGPRGFAGGDDGLPGRNRLIRADGETTELDAKCTVELEPGDCLVIETPGGAGWGADEER